VGAGRSTRVRNPRHTSLKSLPKPAHLEIEIDEWQAARGNIKAVNVRVSWRGARDDPALKPLLAALPPKSGYVPIKLAGGRTELAPESWKGLRFGKGRPIYELARKNYEAWADGSYFERARESAMVMMIRRLVPNFDDYPIEAQIDFIGRTQIKLDEVRKSVGDLVSHLEYAAPEKAKAIAPLKEPSLNVRAAVFCALMGERPAGEALGVPHTATESYGNQRVRQRARIGRRLLCDYYGAVEYDATIARMRRYYEWWTCLTSKAPKEQMYMLLAKAQHSSAELEKCRAEEDGFDEKLTEWVDVVERHQEAEEIFDRSENPDTKEGARQTANQLLYRQIEIEETDARFKAALDALESPPRIA
jgi:hypothetical protein